MQLFHYVSGNMKINLKKGDILILAAFGGGFTWGAIYLKWACDPIRILVLAPFYFSCRGKINTDTAKREGVIR